MAGRPKPTAVARLIAGITAAAAVLLALPFVAQAIPYYAFSLAEAEDRISVVAVLLVLALGAYLVYRNALRITMLLPWSHNGRRDARVEVPAELVAACLRGVDFECPGCGYNLRSLDRSSCPECNRPVRLAFTDAESRPMAVGFFLTLCWLMLTLAVNIVASYATFKVIAQFLSSPWMAGGGGSLSGPYGWYMLTYGAFLALDAAVIVTCLVRLWRLRAVGGAVGSRWTHSTIVTLIVVDIIWLLATAVQSVITIMYM
jgi:hypothetical protein